MLKYDFDPKLQSVFKRKLSDYKKMDWKAWLDINSREEYEELSLRLSGLDKVLYLLRRIKVEKIKSREFSLDLHSFFESKVGLKLPILCHTSGTTSSRVSDLKWFYMSPQLIYKIWGPGMQAIFESSRLTKEGSVVIFIPSRMSFDGLNEKNGLKYVSLYSSEFSQRLMLSIIQPNSYLIDEYKHSIQIDTIAKILSIPKISVISAPALTILKWNNIERLKSSISIFKKTEFQRDDKEIQNKVLNKIRKIINKYNIEKAALKIRNLLSVHLSKAIIIFSTSNLSENQWNLIRSFMQWERGKEKFTNLYVASEIGPFASSLPNGDFTISRENKMYVFPLTIPVLEYNNSRSLLTQSKNKFGKLLVSRYDDKNPLVNIDLGDMITIKKQEGVPQISGDIIRSGFIIKYPLKLSPKLTIPSKFKILAGYYFKLPNFFILNPKKLLDCIKKNMEYSLNYLVLYKSYSNSKPWKFSLFVSNEDKSMDLGVLRMLIMKCPLNSNINNLLNNNSLELEVINEKPIDFVLSRDLVLKNVGSGKVPKGILKKWPLYIIIPDDMMNKINL